MVPEAMAQRRLRVNIRIFFYLFIFFLFWGVCGTHGRLTAPISQKATYLAAAKLKKTNKNNKKQKTQKTQKTLK